MALFEGGIEQPLKDHLGVVSLPSTASHTRLDQLVHALTHDETIDQDTLIEKLGLRPGLVETVLEEENVEKE